MVAADAYGDTPAVSPHLSKFLPTEAIKKTLGVQPSSSVIKIFQIQHHALYETTLTLFERQGRLTDTVIQSQNETNDANPRRRYSHYPRNPELRQHTLSVMKIRFSRRLSPSLLAIIMNPAP